MLLRRTRTQEARLDETHVSKLRGLTGCTAAAVGTQDLQAQRSIEKSNELSAASRSPFGTMWRCCALLELKL